MSYTIVYDRQMIKLPNNHFIFCVLAGDNNVWEAGCNKRARNWDSWNFNQTSSEIENEYLSMCGKEIQEHFKSGNKFLNDKELMSWVKSSIKNAKTVEEILLLKPFVSINCYLWIHKGGDLFHHKEFDEYIHSTKDLTEWVEKATKRTEFKSSDEKFSFVVKFNGDAPLYLNSKSIPDGKTVALYKNSYITKVNERGEWTNASSDIKDALVFGNIYEAYNAVKNSRGNISFIDYDKALESKKTEKEKNIVIKLMSKKGYSRGYFVRGTKTGIRFSYCIDYAKRFDKTGVNAALKRLKNKCLSDTEFEIINLKEKKETV